jgi:hypothetical protein
MIVALAACVVCSDNCELTSNAGQQDSDGDTVGDDCGTPDRGGVVYSTAAPR